MYFVKISYTLRHASEPGTAQAGHPASLIPVLRHLTAYMLR